MTLKPLSLESLKDLDPAIAHEIDQALKKLAKDLYDRPTDNRPRTVTIKIEMKPQADVSGALADVKMGIDVTAKVPSGRSIIRTLAVDHRAQDTL